MAVKRQSRPSATSPRSITRLRTFGSMLPPQNKRTTRFAGEVRFSFPERQAASGVAPAPSTTPFSSSDDAQNRNRDLFFGDGDGEIDTIAARSQTRSRRPAEWRGRRPVSDASRSASASPLATAAEKLATFSASTAMILLRAAMF